MTTCARCTDLFEATRSDARFCSGACRVAAYRDRKAAREAEFRTEAAHLFRDHSRAARAGNDPDTLADFERRAARLFRDAAF